MSHVRSVESPRKSRPIEVSEEDLQAAWAVLENLAVSLDQIGGVFGDATGPDREGRRHELLAALGSYLSEGLVKSIGDARDRLAKYVPDSDAEALADSIPYWDYEGIQGGNLREQASRTDRAAFDRILAKVPDIEPEAADRIGSE